MTTHSSNTASASSHASCTTATGSPCRLPHVAAPARESYDVVVIGAGVIGCCTARELARYNLSVLVIEAGLDVACGATRANSGIVHAGYDPLPGTLKSKYNIAGAALYPQWQRELGFGYYKNGALVLAFDDGERKTLKELLDRAKAAGLEDVRIIEHEELHALEPNVSPDALCALDVPQSGIADPYGLTFAAAENAAHNGVEFLFGHRVESISYAPDKGYALQAASTVTSQQESSGTATFTCTARAIVNAAGVHADEINNMVSARKLAIEPRKGEYLLYNNALADTFRRTVFQAPSAEGKGVLVSPVVFGNIFIGPNASSAAGKEDLSTTAEGQHSVLEKARRTWPEVSTDQVIATYAGLRASDASGSGDFVIGEAPDAEGFFNAACIDSPGLASAPAIATDLAAMTAKRLGAAQRADFDPQRVPAPLLVMMPEDAVSALVAENPLYDVPVCKCCHVSEGELVDALHRKIPVLTIDALKWRTGATMGPCHGGRCTAKIMEIAMRELGLDAPLALKRQPESATFAAAAHDLSEQAAAASTDADKGTGARAVGAAQEAGPTAQTAVQARAAGNAQETLREAAREIRNHLEADGMREVGAGALDIAGTRPAGVCSALQALELLALSPQGACKQAVVWGTHDPALQSAAALAQTGTDVLVVESADAPAGSARLRAQIEALGIPVRCGWRAVQVLGEGRISAVELVDTATGTREKVECDLLVASPYLVPALD